MSLVDLPVRVLVVGLPCRGEVVPLFVRAGDRRVVERGTAECM